MKKSISNLIKKGIDSPLNRRLIRVAYLEGKEEILTQMVAEALREGDVYAWGRHRNNQEKVQIELKKLLKQ
jgi:hypothetical protein